MPIHRGVIIALYFSTVGSPCAITREDKDEDITIATFC